MAFWVDMDHRVLIVLLSLWSSVMPEDFRLVGGASRCAGILEMAKPEKWEPVQDSDLATAAKMCGQLDCGSIVSARGIQVKQMSSFHFELDITCSDSFRLVNGTDLCSGRLEIKSNQSWSPVCKKGFDRPDAEMVCRQLGCGAPSAFQGELHGGLQCEGTAVGLTCSDPDEFRLVDGAHRCAGILELKHNGEWRVVNKQGDAWSLKMSTKICGWLDCGSVVSTQQTKGHSEKHAHILNSTCFRSKYSLRECVLIKDTNTKSRLKITCSDSFRLVNGTDLCSGRLEIKSNQSWSPVCKKGFDRPDAEMVCRQLGCGASSAFQGEFHGGLQCEGAAVGLTCSDPDEFRLVDGAHRCAGILELKHNGEWRVVNKQIGAWSLKTSTKICRWLDCGSVVSTQQTNGHSEKHAHILNSTCFRSKYSLRECVLIKDTKTNSRLEITCSVPLTRLVSGTDLCSGRLEVKPSQSWSSVCGDGFDQQDAEVVCRELGCGAPSAFHMGLHGEKASAVLMEEFHCEGNESALLDCRRSASAAKTCSAVRLNCSDPLDVRLMGEAHRCAGELQMKNQGEWRPVVDFISDWNQESAAAVCRQLGCGSAVSTHGTEAEERPVWWIHSTCVRLTTALTDCVMLTGSSEFYSGHQVICSDLLAQPNISLSPSTNGPSQAERGPVQVLMGSDFTITCATEPQYQGGTFQLVFTASDSALNHTLPAANHSARFLFSAADHTHRGDYRCVYHVHLFSHNFSSWSRPLSVAVLDLLAQPNISLSPSTNGPSEAERGPVQVLMGSDFTITCATEPRYQGGTFQLVFTASDSALNHTLPAANHSAHFLFSAADHTHRGDYRCVYHVHLFSHNFSSWSRPLSVAVLAPLTELMIRFAVLLLSVALLMTAPCLTSKVSSRRMSTALGKNSGPSGSGLGSSSNDYENKFESRGNREISQPQPLLDEEKCLCVNEAGK